MGKTVLFRGKPLTLSGPHPRAGDLAPEFEATDNEMNGVKLPFKGKALLILSVPSLDTPVCSLETRSFNERLSTLGGGLEAAVISMDLPFAQKRFCGAEGIQKVRTFSDFKKREFGQKYGLRIEELGLLARAVILVDAQGKVRYVQLVAEVTEEPNYDEVLKACQMLLASTR